MNLLSTGICEAKDGRIMIVWGGRRIVTTCLVPPLWMYQEEEAMGMDIERLWKRRYRWDAGALILTVISPNLKERTDYLLPLIGRNGAVIQDKTGRIWIGYRVPVISSQDPLGALSIDYVTPKNIGSGAGMNMWYVFRIDDFSGLDTDITEKKLEQRWTEQVDRNISAIPSLNNLPDVSGLSLEEMLEVLSQSVSGAGIDVDANTLVMNTCWTEDELTGDLILRGMGGNVMDINNTTRYRWNEEEGLGSRWNNCVIDRAGRQLRITGGCIYSSDTSEWQNYKIEKVCKSSYGQSSSVVVDNFGHSLVAGYKGKEAIPYQVEDEDGIITNKINTDTNREYEEIFDEYNKKEKVIETAMEKIPDETYGKDEIPLTPSEREAQKRYLAGFYYELPTIQQQRVGYCVTQTGLQILSYQWGNTMVIDGEVVGLRLAVSRDGGRTFQPLTPERRK